MRRRVFADHCKRGDVAIPPMQGRHFQRCKCAGKQRPRQWRWRLPLLPSLQEMANRLTPSIRPPQRLAESMRAQPFAALATAVCAKSPNDCAPLAAASNSELETAKHNGLSTPARSLAKSNACCRLLENPLMPSCELIRISAIS